MKKLKVAPGGTEIARTLEIVNTSIRKIVFNQNTEVRVVQSKFLRQKNQYLKNIVNKNHPETLINLR